MRTTFLRSLLELANHDPRIVLLTGDLGYLVVEAFAERHPTRFYNVGVAEQNMVGIATGLAEAGYIPFVYSIATFAVLRPFEFIRNGPILHRLPVRLVGVGGGFEYGRNGLTHYGLEDVGVLRTQPGISVFAPADAAQARAALLATWDAPGPVYYRLGKDERTSVPGLDGRFAAGQVQLVREGSDVLLLALGSIANEAAAAAEALAREGIRAAVAVVASLNPAPTADLAALLARFPLALTVEAHYLVGGVGSLAAEVAAAHGLGCRVVRCGVDATPVGIAGSQDYLHERHGLAGAALVERARHELHRLAG
jgi:transketolase